MKRAFLLAVTALATLLATSCQKDDLGRILSATIEQYEHNADSKAYINSDNYACWEAGDLVSINGTQCSISFKGGSQGAANTAEIDVTQIPTAQDLLAFYPASMVTNLTPTGGTISLPQVQTYRENNGHQIIDNPMAAYCPAEGTELKFRNLGALLKVTIQAGDAPLSLKAILVKGIDNQMLWGTAPLILNYQHQPMLGEVSNGGATVGLSFGNTPAEIAANTSKSFYIVVPDGSSFKNFTIHVVTNQNEFYKKVSPLGHTLLRNHIGALSYTPADADVETGTSFIYTGSIAGFHSNAFGDAQVMFSEGGLLLFDRAVTTIGEDAFSGCSTLTSITLPTGVREIKAYAFYNCTNLGSISLPANLTSIGEIAFSNCRALTTIDLSHTGVTTIEYAVFYECSQLGSISLPEKLTSIGGSGFAGCSNLTSIFLSEWLTEIGISAFANCTSLTTVYVNRYDPDDSSVPPITSFGDWMFDGCTSLIHIYVPVDAVNTYKNAYGWREYADIIQYPPNPPHNPLP